jgi:hypothetical protein
MMAKSILTDLLAELDDAISITDTTYLTLQSAQKVRADAVAKAKAAYDAVVAEQSRVVTEAQAAYDNAKAQRDKIHAKFNERIGVTPDARVSVR